MEQLIYMFVFECKLVFIKIMNIEYNLYIIINSWHNGLIMFVLEYKLNSRSKYSKVFLGC